MCLIHYDESVVIVKWCQRYVYFLQASRTAFLHWKFCTKLERFWRAATMVSWRNWINQKGWQSQNWHIAVYAAWEIYKTLLWTADGGERKFQKVLEVFQNYCSPHKNIVYKRYIFWSLQQEEGENNTMIVSSTRGDIATELYSLIRWILVGSEDTNRGEK